MKETIKARTRWQAQDQIAKLYGVDYSTVSVRLIEKGLYECVWSSQAAEN